MDFDIWTMLAVVIAILIGMAIYYVYNHVNAVNVDKVFKTIKTLFDTYGERILKDNPELHKEIEDALKVMEQAMEDEDIDLMEAFDIIKVYVPLSKRLTEYIKNHYE